MKAAAILSVILVVASTVFGELPQEEIEKAWQQYLVDFDIRLPRSGSIDEYKQNFAVRANLVSDNNAANTGYELEINAFSHLSEEILQATKTGVIPDPENVGSDETELAGEGRNARATAPDSFDWRTIYGVVRPVQDQKSCGSCWAFAAIGALEGQMAIYKRKYEKGSEQEVMECARSADGVLRGCNGGYSSLVYRHSLENKGITTSTYKPYLATTSYKTCNVNSLRVAGSIVASWSFAPSKDEVTIKNWVYNYGPLYVTYHVASDFYNYKNGIYKDNGKLCAGKGSNHAVLLVGYGTENGQDYWICKNSWGASWGESGYFRIARGVNLCNFGSEATYPKLA